VPQPPSSLEQLMTLSDRGLRVGLPLTLTDLYWTSSGVGADAALLRLMEADGAVPDAADRRVLRRWIEWLIAANQHEHVAFADEPGELVSRLKAGELDWTSCTSLWLGPLGARLGANLGVSELPGLPGTPAHSITRLRVWSFGQHSTMRQRQLAKAFVQFTLNPVNQRRLMQAGVANLPVNSEVLVPTKTSPTFRAMAGSLSRARMLSFRQPEHTEERLASMSRLLGRAMLGELTPDQVMAMLISPGSKSAAPAGP
jgi:ABC-type glycerol-3-phosphate transport system substrate-binding protein